jgi:UDP-N-acetyl-D-glucosamine dehydrogenase
MLSISNIRIHMPGQLNAVSPKFSERFNSKVQNWTARVGIIGLGDVGLPLALLFSDQKFSVTGFDIDARKVTALEKGESYIHRILPAEIQAARTHGLSGCARWTQLLSACLRHP